VLSQLSRAPETRPGDHRPILSDLRESGSIEMDSDIVAFIFREEIYRPDKESLKGLAELILAKQRQGPTGRIKLAYLSRYTRFENLASDTDDGSNAVPSVNNWYESQREPEPEEDSGFLYDD
jgi:replicative DNA helicase